VPGPARGSLDASFVADCFAGPPSRCAVLFNKFLKENEQKRRRADHRANDEIKKRMKWEKQIASHKQNVATLREKCDRLKLSVLKNEKHQKYLDKVQDAYATHFDEISSIITRYQTLKSTNTEMIKLQEVLIERNEKARIDFSEYKKKQYNATLSLNNDIASESRELEECVKRTSEVEEQMIHQEKEESEEQRISTQIILATDNLYSRCRRVLSGIRRHGSQRLNAKQKAGMDAVTILKEETCWKLNEIETYLLDFADIIENIEASERADALAAQAQQLDARRAAKLRQVRENHAAYERERAERGTMPDPTRPHKKRAQHDGGGGGGGGGESSYSHSSGSQPLDHFTHSRDLSQNSSMVYHGRSSTS
jgi:hypothetical protein